MSLITSEGTARDPGDAAETRAKRRAAAQAETARTVKAAQEFREESFGGAKPKHIAPRHQAALEGKSLQEVQDEAYAASRKRSAKK